MSSSGNTNEGFSSTQSVNHVAILNIGNDNHTETNNLEVIALNDINAEPNNVDVKNNEKPKLEKTFKKNIDEFDDDDDDNENEGEIAENALGVFIMNSRKKIIDYLKKPIVKWIVGISCIIGYFIYYGFAMQHSKPFYFPPNLNSSMILDNYVFSGNKGLALFILTICVLLMILWDMSLTKLNYTNIIKKLRLTHIIKHVQDNILCQPKFDLYRRWIIILMFLVGCIIYLGVDLKVSYNLISLIGMFVILLGGILASSSPSHIQWRTIVTGLIIQFLLGVFVMRIEFGYKFLRFITDQVTTFLEYADYGGKLVFGDAYKDHYFAFKVMPVIIFFGAMVNLLYYFGAIQYVIVKLAWIVNMLMGTSPTESVNSIANIFLGQTEAPLLIKPFLAKMTVSEIFAVMVAGYASVSGSILAAYIGFGAPATNLVSASVMTAPIGLVVSKIMQPETRLTKANWDTIKNFPKGAEANFFEAYAVGAINMIRNVGAIVASLIAFTALFAFIDNIIIWFFSIVGLVDFGFSSILQYLFWPLAFIMGTSAEDCGSVAKLIGIKIFVNELVAYQAMGAGIDFRKQIIASGTYELYRNGTLTVPSTITMLWNDRSISIATFALCGFANMASIGIQIGGLSALEPKRAKLFPKLAFKAMIAGNMASWLNACIAGLLFNKL